MLHLKCMKTFLLFTCTKTTYLLLLGMYRSISHQLFELFHFCKSDECPTPLYVKDKLFLGLNHYQSFGKEYKLEAQCAQKAGRMLVLVICGFIKNVLPNSYFILQIYHVKSFKMMHVLSLYFNFSIRYS